MKRIKDLKNLINITLIIILGFFVYSNSLSNKFIWDDQYLIKENTYIRSWHYLPKIFAKDIGEGSGAIYGFYRPLQILTYAIDYSLWKLNVQGFHLTNIMLHILVGLCIYWLINIFYDNKILSLLTSIFFVTSPLHTETVTYISGRQESLAFLFILLSLIFYIKHLNLKSVKTYTLTILTYILALLSKEISIIFPGILLFYHYVFKEKLNLKKFIPIVGIDIIYILLRITLLRSFFHLPSSSSTTILQRIPGFFAAIYNYLKILILPLNLYPEYGNPLFKITNPQVLTGIVILLFLLIYAFKNRNKRSLIFFSLGWFFITLLPVSNIYPLSTYMRQHWLYIPSLGFFLILAKASVTLIRKKRFKIISIIFSISLLFFYSYLTLRQNTYWKEPIAFYKRALKYTPENSNIYNNLGNSYLSIGKKKNAIKMFKKAIELNSKNAVAYNNLGTIYAILGKNQKAIELYKKAIEINPDYIKPYSNLGVEYCKMGKIKEGIRILKKAIEINPDYADSYFNLALTYQNLGNLKEATFLYKKVIEINPDYANAYFNLALLLNERGKKNEAIVLLKKAKTLSPFDAQIYYNLGVIYSNLGRIEESIASYKKAIELKPDFKEAYNNLSIIYLNQKKYKLALKYCEKAEELGLKNLKLLEALKPYRE